MEKKISKKTLSKNHSIIGTMDTHMFLSLVKSYMLQTFGYLTSMSIIEEL